MRLRSIGLWNVRRFAGRTATLSGIGDGLTVVSEANEFGKSTFFDALHALFFEKFGATSRAVRSLQPYSGGGVKVAAEVETADGRFRIEKRWLGQKGASVSDAASGTLIATDGAAESWLAALIGDSRDGPTGLLWVRQGVQGLEPSGASGAEKAERDRLTETRRDLLSSVAGEIDAMTGGQRMDRVLRRCREDLAALTTPTGRPTGAWKAALDAVAELSAGHARLDAQCRALAGALKERGEALAELARLDAPAARAARVADLARARAGFAEAEAQGVKIAEARQALRIALLERDEARRRLDALVAAEGALARAITLRDRAEGQAADAEAALVAARAGEESAGAALARTGAELAAARQAVEAAQRRALAQAAARRAEDLGKRLAAAEIQRAGAEAGRAAVAANPATKARLSALETAEARLSALRWDLAAGAPSFRIRYLGETRAFAAGEVLPGDRDTPFRAAMAVDLPGIARIELDPGDAARAGRGDGDEAAAVAALAAALKACGAGTVEAAREAALARDEAEAAARLAEGRQETLAPEGLDALRAEVRAARDAAGIAGERAGGGDAVPGVDPDDDPGARLADLAAAEAAARAAFAAASDRRARAGADLAGARARAESASAALAQAEAAAGPADTRADRRTAAASAAAISESAARTAEEALESLRARAPDFLSAKANLTRAETAAKASEDRRASLSERRAELSARIAAEAEQGLEERRDRVAGDLAAATARAARLEAEAAALQRLRAVLEETRSAARDAYFGPVQEELRPLLGLLHDEAELRFHSDTLLPESLVRGTAEEGIDALSGGTQEQIAILTRLAFARLLARQGRPLPVILDDALVHSDDERIVRMFTALNRVALDQQILVFTCRQLAFEALGGARGRVEIE